MAQIGAFKVVSEAGIASGVRRIEAVVGPAAVQYLNQVDGVVRTLASQLKVKFDDIPVRVAGESWPPFSAAHTLLCALNNHRQSVVDAGDCFCQGHCRMKR